MERGDFWMPYYACLRANSSFKRVFTIVATAFGNIHIEEHQRRDGSFLGIVVGQDFLRRSKEFIGTLLLLEDMGEKTLIKFIALGGIMLGKDSTFLKNCEEQLSDLIKTLSKEGIGVEVLERNSHFFREYGD
ncbi:MAG: hypothetical protein ACTSX9_07980 [Candidatus Njordarchaeales archaeon]